MNVAPTIIQAVPLTDYQKVVEQLDSEQRARAAAEARVRELLDEVVDVLTACELTGLGRTTLYEECRRPDTLLVRVPNGRAVGFTRASCVAYRKAKELGRHRLAA